ncbi:DMT family transporter [Limnochorda pilosa]|uniref:DMT family transporter n=1 Tax=Limnochorda pilosa TaxID=1555112 RepID=UPI0026EC7D81|nr:DMT family transporter [Limnochorda pilosa]
MGAGSGAGPEVRRAWAGWVVALGVGAVSCAAVLVRLSQAPPETLAFYRLLFALAVLVPASLTPGRRGAYARLRAQDWGLGILAGTFVALHYATWFASVRLTSVLSATVLVTLQPFFVLLLGFLLWRRRVPVRAGVGLLLALAGSFLIGGGNLALAERSTQGDLLALLAAFLISVYLVVGEVQRARQDLLTYSCVVYGSAALVLALVAWARGSPLGGFPLREWWIFGGLAAGPTLLGHTLFLWALAYVPAAFIAVAILGEPVAATFWAWLFLGEVPALHQVVGGGLILGGVAWYQLRASSAPEAPRVSVPAEPGAPSGPVPGGR